MKGRRCSPGAFRAHLRFVLGHAIAPAVCAASLAASKLLVASAMFAIPLRRPSRCAHSRRPRSAGPCEIGKPELRLRETPMRDQLIRFPR